MRTILLIVLLSISASTTKAQPSDGTTIPKRAWKIIITNNLSADENFKLAGRKLIENDFTIEKKDIEFGQIKSSEREIKGLDASFFLKIATTDNQITITGEAKSNMTIYLSGVAMSDSFARIEFKGMKGSLSRNSFDQMDSFAKQFDGSIRYICD